MSEPDGNGKQNSPTNWFELARYLIITKRGLKFIGFLMTAIALVLLLSIYFIHPALLSLRCKLYQKLQVLK